MALVLRGRNVWDGLSNGPRPLDVVVNERTVLGVQPMGSYSASGDDVIFELGEGFLLPGLLDMHVHLVWDGSPNPAATVEREGEQLTTIRAGANAGAQLRAGVTTVRDLGSNWDIAITVARAISHGVIDGPEVIASGRTVIMTGGHDPFWGIFSDGVDAVRRAVRHQVHMGAGVIKAAATGGAYGRPEGEDIGQVELSYDELAALAAEAHRFGLKATAHALGTEGVRNAVLAGFDCIEHGVFLDEQIVDEMLERHTVYSPTVATYRALAAGNGIPEYAQHKAERVIAAHRESVAMALAAGIPIVAGTDAGAPNMPSPSIVEELIALQDCGMSAVEALKSATSRAATALGRSELGVIRAGSRADLVVVPGDPFADLNAVRQVSAVIRNGRRFAG